MGPNYLEALMVHVEAHALAFDAPGLAEAVRQGTGLLGRVESLRSWVSNIRVYPSTNIQLKPST